MSRSYKTRQKAIRHAKRHYEGKNIPERDFIMLQAQWRREVDGPPIGTLADLISAQFAKRSEAKE